MAFCYPIRECFGLLSKQSLTFVQILQAIDSEVSSLWSSVQKIVFTGHAAYKVYLPERVPEICEGFRISRRKAIREMALLSRRIVVIHERSSIECSKLIAIH
jgi:hypothetical protein